MKTYATFLSVSIRSLKHLSMKSRSGIREMEEIKWRWEERRKMNHWLKLVSHHIVSLQGGNDSVALQTNTVGLTPSSL